MKVSGIAAAAALGCAAATASAMDLIESHYNYYYFQTSVATTHFDPKPEHNNNQDLLNIERRNGDGLVVGGAYFLNSFYQPSQYLYVGRLYYLPYTEETVYAKLTGGLLHGYRGEYQDQIPFNRYGVAPAILPALGFQGRTYGGEVVVFGTAGVMLTLGFKF